MRFLLFLFMLAAMPASADDEVEIYGKANTKSGKPVEATFDFKEPKVEPIFVIEPQKTPKTPTKKVLSDALRVQDTKEINQFSPQNPKPFSISPQKEKDEIENTLYEGGDRIYDVQSFPLKDIKIITEPNVDPTISTYPEY